MPPRIPRTFAEWLTAHLDLPTQEIAERLGVHRTRVSQIRSLAFATPYIAWQLEQKFDLRVPAELVRGRGV